MISETVGSGTRIGRAKEKNVPSLARLRNVQALIFKGIFILTDWK